MEAQEAKREAALAVARARQDVQAAAAQARPESKRWIDPELIERYARSCRTCAAPDLNCCRLQCFMLHRNRACVVSACVIEDAVVRQPDLCSKPALERH